ncbi:endonuclease [Escherichia phage vB-Eco-KMB41]|nr:endonuclease [Escherichia phage vB-Eco-KMB41]
MKQCAICQTVKPLEDFHRNKRTKDGRDCRCKVCKGQKYREYYHGDPSRKERIIANVKTYQAGPGREKANATKSHYQERHPKKRKAHNLVRNALRRGELHRGPCEVCGADKVVGHHDDYDRPLAVRWLCERHHKEWHLVHGEALNPD